MASPRRRTSAAVCGVDANHVDDAWERDGVARRGTTRWSSREGSRAFDVGDAREGERER
jgi:hypothetical protein